MVRCRFEGELKVFCAQDGRTISLPSKGPFEKSLRHIPVEEIGFDLAQYNHYAIKTFDSYLLRRLRGRGAVAQTGGVNNRHTFDYFADRAGRGKPELSVLRYAAETQALMSQWLGIPAIAAAHHRCLQAYGEAIASLPDPEL